MTREYITTASIFKLSTTLLFKLMTNK